MFYWQQYVLGTKMTTPSTDEQIKAMYEQSVYREPTIDGDESSVSEAYPQEAQAEEVENLTYEKMWSM